MKSCVTFLGYLSYLCFLTCDVSMCCFGCSVSCCSYHGVGYFCGLGRVVKGDGCSSDSGSGSGVGLIGEGGIGVGCYSERKC
jgi:hypothetical protein